MIPFSGRLAALFTIGPRLVPSGAPMLLVAFLAGGTSGCGFACNYGLSPCPVGAEASGAGARPAGAQGRCPTEYRPTCIDGQQQCTTDRNGCTVCDCLSRLRTVDAVPGDPRQTP